MHDKYKICPECGKSTISWDGYFSAYRCLNKDCGAFIKPEIECPNCKGDNIGKLLTSSYVKIGNMSMSSLDVCKDCGTVFINQKRLKRIDKE